MTMIWVQQGGVWRQVNRKIDSALVNRDAALSKLRESPRDGTVSTTLKRNQLTLIALKSSLEAGLGDVSLKEVLL